MLFHAKKKGNTTEWDIRDKSHRDDGADRERLHHCNSSEDSSVSFVKYLGPISFDATKKGNTPGVGIDHNGIDKGAFIDGTHRRDGLN